MSYHNWYVGYSVDTNPEISINFLTYILTEAVRSILFVGNEPLHLLLFEKKEPKHFQIICNVAIFLKHFDFSF